MEKITFSIRQSLRESWDIFKKNRVFFIVLAFVLFILKIVAPEKQTHILAILAGVASFVVYLTLLKAALTVTKDTTHTLTLREVGVFLPTMREFFGTIAISIVAGLIVVFGVVVVAGVLIALTQNVVGLIIGGVIGLAVVLFGIYVALRFLLATYFFVEGKLSLRSALSASWHATKNLSVARKTILVVISMGIFGMLGFVVFGLGILVTYPLSLLVIAHYYYVAKRFGITTVTPQPAEIAPTPEPLP